MNLLEGIKVVDFTTIVLGPYASQFLGDFGADEFHNIDLRTSQNWTWAWFGAFPPGARQNTLIRDIASRDTQGALGQPRGRKGGEAREGSLVGGGRGGVQCHTRGLEKARQESAGGLVRGRRLRAQDALPLRGARQVVVLPLVRIDVKPVRMPRATRATDSG